MFLHAFLSNFPCDSNNKLWSVRMKGQSDKQTPYLHCWDAA